MTHHPVIKAAILALSLVGGVTAFALIIAALCVLGMIGGRVA